MRRLSRRGVLKTLGAAGLCAAAPARIFGEPVPGGGDWRAEVTAYLDRLSRPDGGYAWEDQPDSHLTPTFAVIGCHQVLGRRPPNPDMVAEFVRTHHPSRLKKLEQERRVFVFQQVQALVWLGADASSFREQVRAWRKPVAYLARYERHGYPVFQSEMGAFTCRELLGLPAGDLSGEFTDYLDARRRPNGSFNNTRVADGGDGHVMNTWWGLQALRVLGRTSERREETIAWLRACQLPCGGFTWQPKAEIAGWDDAAYTWAAARALALLGAAPSDREACVRSLLSLWNSDGGFGDRPGWASNPLASFYALDAMAALDALPTEAAPRKPPAPRPPLPEDLNVYSIQIEAHGKGSPAEAVDLAQSLRIHLWGAKNAAPGWIARAQALADSRKAPVAFFVANEEYGTWVDVPGLGTYSHTSDLVAPAGADIGPSLAGNDAASWPEFRRRRIDPLTRAGGRLIWQFGENEELVRLFLDDSLQRGGYAAISTFHFGNPDFTNSEPFLNRWRGRIPFIALQDAHGNEPWWFADMTTGFRTLFLAQRPSWEGWLEALRENRVVAVRHDAVSGYKTWMHGGSKETVDFVLRRSEQWRWWDNPDIRRPMVSIVAVTPEDEFEVARPEKGIVIRVRCAWENTAQGLPKKPLAELVKLVVDGKDVAAVRSGGSKAKGKAKQGAGPNDAYHAYPMPAPARGRHTATAVVRAAEGGQEFRRTIEFDV